MEDILWFGNTVASLKNLGSNNRVSRVLCPTQGERETGTSSEARNNKLLIKYLTMKKKNRLVGSVVKWLKRRECD